MAAAMMPVRRRIETPTDRKTFGLITSGIGEDASLRSGPPQHEAGIQRVRAGGGEGSAPLADDPSLMRFECQPTTSLVRVRFPKVWLVFAWIVHDRAPGRWRRPSGRRP